MPETPGEPSPVHDLLAKLAATAPTDNPRLQNLIVALNQAVDADERRRAEADALLAQYEEAYEKLTAPANRIGVYVQALSEDLHLIAVGDQEFVVLRDPSMAEALVAGDRVKVNEGYAIVGKAPVATGGAIVKVGEVMEDGRLRLGGDGPGESLTGGRLILRSDALKDTLIKRGDEVRLDASGRFAIEHFDGGKVNDYFLEEIPEVTWDQIGGQDEAIKLIKETIETPLLHPELFSAFGKKPVKGILLYGPPGCGKTLIGKATAHNLTKEYGERQGREVKEYFMSVSGPKLLNMWVGETERMVRELFSTAREKAKDGYLVFIFMDEAESLLRTRSSGRHFAMSNTVVPQFAAEIDGVQGLENVVLILTSNRPDYIDPAILRPGRIDRKVRIIRPDKESTREIIGIYITPSMPLDETLVSERGGNRSAAREALIDHLTNLLWRKTSDTEFLKIFRRDGGNETLYWSNLLSGAILENIIDRATDFAIRRAIADQTTPGLRAEDLTEAAEREFKESDIFPKGDGLEDWLQLLDIEPESVATIRPIREHKGEALLRKGIL